MVGCGDGEHHADGLGRMGSRQVIVECGKVGLPVDVAHHLVGLHDGRERLHARHGQRQIGTAMGNHDFHVGIAGKHIAADHVGHGACRLGQVFLHGKRRLRHHLAIDGIRAMRMQDDDGLPLVEHGKKRVQFRRTQVLSLDIGRQLDAVSPQCVERINRLADSRIHIGQRQSGTEQESARMLALDAGCLLVGRSHHGCRRRLRSRQRQHRGLDTCLVHPPQMVLHIILRQRKTLLHEPAFGFQRRNEARSDDVAMHIHHSLGQHA